MDTRCNKLNCFCTHTDGCEKGFIWVRYKHTEKRMREGKQILIETWYDGVRFCPICDPERAHIQDTSTSSEELAERLRNRSSLRSSDNYDREEATRTRTL
jgi:uncharacterized Zn finger protein (UPF0148 family)